MNEAVRNNILYRPKSRELFHQIGTMRQLSPHVEQADVEPVRLSLWKRPN